MPDRIRKAVAIERDLISGVGWQDEIHEAIARFASAALYRDTPAQVEKIRRKMVALLAKKWLPEAQEVGRKTTEPILDGLGDDLTRVGTSLRGRVLDKFRKYHRMNLLAFRAQLRGELGRLSDSVELAFAYANRDNLAKRKLIDMLVQSDKAELARIAAVRKEIEATGQALQAAEERLGNATTGRQTARAKDSLKAAKKAHQRAKGKMPRVEDGVVVRQGSVKSFYARFETKVQAAARDAIRREAQQAAQSFYENQGYTTFTWVTVNGTDACPSCDERHGLTHSAAEWAGDGPGEGGTYCGAACMCQLVPEEYAASNQGLKEPVRMSGRSSGQQANPLAKGSKTPIKVGGKLASQAKEAAKRAASIPSPTRKLSDGRSVYGAGGKEYVRSKASTLSRDEVVLVDPAKVDALWSRDESYYVPRGGVGGAAISGRYEQFGQWLSTSNEPIEMSEFGLRVSSLRGGGEIVEVGFDNGRHRFAWLRDHGATEIPVAVDKGTAARVAKYVGAKK